MSDYREIIMKLNAGRVIAFNYEGIEHYGHVCGFKTNLDFPLGTSVHVVDYEYSYFLSLDEIEL